MINCFQPFKYWTSSVFGSPLYSVRSHLVSRIEHLIVPPHDTPVWALWHISLPVPRGKLSSTWVRASGVAPTTGSILLVEVGCEHLWHGPYHGGLCDGGHGRHVLQRVRVPVRQLQIYSPGKIWLTDMLVIEINPLQWGVRFWIRN